MYKFSRWYSCVNTKPKRDGTYLVMRLYNGKLSYASALPYTTEWGWNTYKDSHDHPIVFGEDKLDRFCMWTEVTEDNKKRR